MSTFETIAKIVERVTGKPAADVTPAMTFFEASVDSLDHIEVVLEVENDFDIDFPQRDLDETDTIGQLAELADRMLAERKAMAA